MRFDHYIFDLDGTLVETKEIHRNVFNDTLRHFGFEPIHERHFPLFEGLPSTEKIKEYASVYFHDIDPEPFLKEKQRRSVEALKNKNFYDEDIYEIFKGLSRSKEVSIATNCTEESARIILNGMRISFFVDHLSHNKSGEPKPAPDLYRNCIDRAKIPEQNTIIFEDNEKGLDAAKAASSEACIIRVSNPTQLKKLFL